MLLVGNKADLVEQREVKTQEGIDLAQANGIAFLETSALDATNIEVAF